MTFIHSLSFFKSSQRSFYSRRYLIKTLSALLILAFLGQDLLVAAPEPAKLIQFSDISIPQQIGLKDFSKKLSGEETIIHIKDAHASLGTQKSIACLIEDFTKKYEINLVGLEGSEGLVDTSTISSFPSAAIRKEVAESFLADTKISAAEFFKIISADEKTELYGVENQKVYAGNLRDYQRLLNVQKEVDPELKKLSDLADEIGKAYLSPEALDLFLKNKQHEENILSFEKYWVYLESLLNTHGASFSQWTHLVKLSDLLKLEKQIDFSAAEKERDVLIQELHKRLDAAAFKSLIDQALELKSGHMSAGVFYGGLLQKAREYQIILSSGSYEDLLLYEKYLKGFDQIDLLRVTEELDLARDLMKEKVLVSEKEKKVARLIDNIRLFSDLLQGKLTSAQNKDYSRRRSSLGAQVLRQWISDLSDGQVHEKLSQVDFEKISRARILAERFYKKAHARDQFLLNNLIRRMKEKKVHSAILVTGGFHSDGISNLMTEDQISHVVVLPKSDEADVQRPYAVVITQKGSYLDHALKIQEQLKGIVMLIGLAVLNGASLDEAKRMYLEAYSKTVKKSGTTSFIGEPVSSVKSLTSEAVYSLDKKAEDKIAPQGIYASYSLPEQIVNQFVLKLGPAFKRGPGKLVIGSADPILSQVFEVERSGSGHAARIYPSTLSFSGLSAQAQTYQSIAAARLAVLELERPRITSVVDNEAAQLVHFDKKLSDWTLSQFGNLDGSAREKQGASYTKFNLSAQGKQILADLLNHDIGTGKPATTKPISNDQIHDQAEISLYQHDGKLWPLGIIFYHQDRFSYLDLADLYADPQRKIDELQWQKQRTIIHPSVSNEIAQYFKTKTQIKPGPVFALVLTSNENSYKGPSRRGTEHFPVIERQIYNIYKAIDPANLKSGRLKIAPILFDPADRYSRDWQAVLLRLKNERPEIFKGKRTVILGSGPGTDIFYVDPGSLLATIDKYAGSTFLTDLNIHFSTTMGQLPPSSSVKVIQADQVPDNLKFDLGLMNAPAVDFDLTVEDRGVFGDSYRISYKKFISLFDSIQGALYRQPGSKFLIRLNFNPPDFVKYFISSYPNLGFENVGKDFYLVSQKVGARLSQSDGFGPVADEQLSYRVVNKTDKNSPDPNQNRWIADGVVRRYFYLWNKRSYEYARESRWQNSPVADLAIIGGGPGGLSSGIHAAHRGLKVALFERGYIAQSFSDAYMKMVHWMRTAPTGGIGLVQQGQSDEELLREFDLVNPRILGPLRKFGQEARAAVTKLYGDQFIGQPKGGDALDNVRTPLARNEAFQHFLNVAKKIVALGGLISEEDPVISVQKETLDGQTLHKITTKKGIVQYAKQVIYAPGLIGPGASNEKEAAILARIANESQDSYAKALNESSAKKIDLKSSQRIPILTSSMLGQDSLREWVRALPEGSQVAVVGSGESAAKSAIELLNINTKIKVHYFAEYLLAHPSQSPLHLKSAALSAQSFFDEALRAKHWQAVDEHGVPVTIPTVANLKEAAERGSVILHLGAKFDEANGYSVQTVKNDGKPVAHVFKDGEEIAQIDGGFISAVGYDRSKSQTSPFIQKLVKEEIVELDESGEIKLSTDGLSSAKDADFFVSGLYLANQGIPVDGSVYGIVARARQIVDHILGRRAPALTQERLLDIVRARAQFLSDRLKNKSGIGPYTLASVQPGKSSDSVLRQEINFEEFPKQAIPDIVLAVSQLGQNPENVKKALDYFFGQKDPTVYPDSLRAGLALAASLPGQSPESVGNLYQIFKDYPQAIIPALISIASQPGRPGQDANQIKKWLGEFTGYPEASLPLLLQSVIYPLQTPQSVKKAYQEIRAHLEAEKIPSQEIDKAIGHLVFASVHLGYDVPKIIGLWEGLKDYESAQRAWLVRAAVAYFAQAGDEIITREEVFKYSRDYAESKNAALELRLKVQESIHPDEDLKAKLHEAESRQFRLIEKFVIQTAAGLSNAFSIDDLAHSPEKVYQAIKSYRQEPSLSFSQLKERLAEDEFQKRPLAQELTSTLIWLHHLNASDPELLALKGKPEKGKYTRSTVLYKNGSEWLAVFTFNRTPIHDHINHPVGAFRIIEGPVKEVFYRKTGVDAPDGFVHLSQIGQVIFEKGVIHIVEDTDIHEVIGEDENDPSGKLVLQVYLQSTGITITNRFEPVKFEGSQGLYSVSQTRIASPTSATPVSGARLVKTTLSKARSEAMVLNVGIPIEDRGFKAALQIRRLAAHFESLRKSLGAEIRPVFVFSSKEQQDRVEKLLADKKVSALQFFTGSLGSLASNYSNEGKNIVGADQLFSGKISHHQIDLRLAKIAAGFRSVGFSDVRRRIGGELRTLDLSQRAAYLTHLLGGLGPVSLEALRIFGPQALVEPKVSVELALKDHPAPKVLALSYGLFNLDPKRRSVELAFTRKQLDMIKEQAGGAGLSVAWIVPRSRQSDFSADIARGAVGSYSASIVVSDAAAQTVSGIYSTLQEQTDLRDLIQSPQDLVVVSNSSSILTRHNQDSLLMLIDSEGSHTLGWFVIAAWELAVAKGDLSIFSHRNFKLGLNGIILFRPERIDWKDLVKFVRSAQQSAVAA